MKGRLCQSFPILRDINNPVDIHPFRGHLLPTLFNQTPHVIRHMSIHIWFRFLWAYAPQNLKHDCTIINDTCERCLTCVNLNKVSLSEADYRSHQYLKTHTTKSINIARRGSEKAFKPKGLGIMQFRSHPPHRAVIIRCLRR